MTDKDIIQAPSFGISPNFFLRASLCHHQIAIKPVKGWALQPAVSDGVKISGDGGVCRGRDGWRPPAQVPDKTNKTKQTNKQTNKTNLRRFQPGAPYIGIEGVGYGLTPLRSSATGKSSTLGGRFLRKDRIKGKVQKNG